ncbi:hypothetical protein L6452_45206 [Arctium lappa]|nr:hypothetical protein L6452_45206 [Arctium lappa]
MAGEGRRVSIQLDAKPIFEDELDAKPDLDFGDGFLVTLVLVHHLFHNSVQDESKHLRLEASSNEILMSFSFANLEAISKITWKSLMKSTNLEAIDEISTGLGRGQEKRGFTGKGRRRVREIHREKQREGVGDGGRWKGGRHLPEKRGGIGGNDGVGLTDDPF